MAKVLGDGVGVDVESVLVSIGITVRPSKMEDVIVVTGAEEGGACPVMVRIEAADIGDDTELVEAPGSENAVSVLVLSDGGGGGTTIVAVAVADVGDEGLEIVLIVKEEDEDTIEPTEMVL